MELVMERSGTQAAYAPPARPKRRAVRALAPWLLPCAVYALVWLVFGVRYEVNDDAILSNIAAGAYGPDTQYLVYINIAVGWLLKPLYALVPGFNWLYAVQSLAAVGALGVLCRLLCGRLGARRGLLLGLVVLMLAGVEAFYSFQYVKNSGLYLIAGFALLAEGLGRWDRRTLGGVFWVVLGALLRAQMFPAVGALAAPLLLSRFLALDRAGKKRAVATMALLFALVGAFWGADRLAYDLDEGWRAYREYNAARTKISDFRLQYATADDLAALGYSANDLSMLNGWSYWDDQVFGAEQLQALADALPGNDPVRAAKETAYRCLSVLDGQPFHLLLAGAALAWLFFARRAKSWAFPATVCMFGALVFYLSLQGRYEHRVEYVLVAGAAVLGLWDCRWRPAPALRGVRAFAFCAALAAVFCLPAWRQTRADMIQYRIDRGSRTDFSRYAADKEHLYLADVDATDQLAGYDVLHPREKGYFSNIVEIGGWLSHAPHRVQALADYGVADPYRDMIDRADVYLLDAYQIETKRVYMAEHYGAVEFEAVAADGGFQVLRAVRAE